MDDDRFITAYRESRNGTENFYFNKVVPNFYYSDGVRECAQAGCYWLLTLFATTVVEELHKRNIQPGDLAIVKVAVDSEQATLTVELKDMDTNPYIHHVDYTDMPSGDWNFYIAYEGPETGYRCILPSEY